MGPVTTGGELVSCGSLSAPLVTSVVVVGLSVVGAGCDESKGPLELADTDSESSLVDDEPGVTGTVGATGEGCTELDVGPVGVTDGLGVTGVTTPVVVVVEGAVVSEVDGSVPVASSGPP
jgi:hypothetical protein